MTHIHLISILFIVVSSLTLIYCSNDQDESQKVITMYENAICKVKNELNNVIISKLLTIMKLEALEKKRFSRMGKSGCSKKRRKKSSMKDREMIENKIFVQIFDRNQTSVENERQPLGIEIVQQAPPKIDIGKLNWTDASFDKTLSGIDFGKITAEELNKILDQSLKQSNCPLGSFFEEGKGCVSIDTFSVVPSTPNTVDIEAIFNQPLKAFPNLTPKGKIDNGDMKIEIESLSSDAEKLLRLISKLKSNGTSSVDTGYITKLKMGDLSNLMSQVGGEMRISGTGDKVDSFVDEGEVASIGRSIKSHILQPAVDAFGTGKIMMNIAKPKMELSSSLPDELNSKIGQQLQLEVDGIQKYLQQKMQISNGSDDAIIVEPQIIKESIPIKMSFKPSDVGEPSSSFQPFKISLPFQFIQKPQGKVEAEMKSPASGEKQENVLISFGNFGKAVGEQIAQHIGAGYELNEDKLSEKSETEFATKASEPKAETKARKKQQAFFVHEVPLINRKSLANDAMGTTQDPTQASTAASTTQTSTTKQKKFIPKLIEAGEDVIKTKNKILSNLFPKLFNGRRFANKVVSPDKETVNQIKKNVPKPQFTFETVEGKTLSDNLEDDDETITEGLHSITTTEATPTISSTILKGNKQPKALPSIKRTSVKPNINEKVSTTSSFVRSSTDSSALVTENIE